MRRTRVDRRRRRGLPGRRAPALSGAYLYADSGERSAPSPGTLRRSATRYRQTQLEQPVSFAEDNGGEVVVLDLAGPVYRLERLTARFDIS
jgi:hypothetical protein